MENGFDRFAKSTASGISRRQMLKYGLAAAIAAATFGALKLGTASADNGMGKSDDGRPLTRGEFDAYLVEFRAFAEESRAFYNRVPMGNATVSGSLSGS